MSLTGEIPNKNSVVPNDVLIVGGGLAGLTTAFILGSAGYGVTLIEQKDYPRHKVCGEYISNEVKPLMQSLGLYPEHPKPVEISRFQFTSQYRKPVEVNMEMGGFGISRYALDHHLCEKAREAGVTVITKTRVTGVDFSDDKFRVMVSDGAEYTARIVVGAHGKRSSLDKAMKRAFMNDTTPYLAVKQHYSADFPEDLVALHNFEGGYAGLSCVEDGRVNMCYLTDARIFKRYGNPEDFQADHLNRQPHLRKFLEEAQPLLEQPLVISQVNFDRKKAVENHVLMCGDAAGLIHPMCGNGMAMAIHASVFCAEFVAAYLEGQMTRSEMESSYATAWREVFGGRLRFGRYASRLFGGGVATDLTLRVARMFPGLFRRSIRLTHGKLVQDVHAHA